MAPCGPHCSHLQLPLHRQPRLFLRSPERPSEAGEAAGASGNRQSFASSILRALTPQATQPPLASTSCASTSSAESNRPGFDSRLRHSYTLCELEQVPESPSAPQFTRLWKRDEKKTDLLRVGKGIPKTFHRKHLPRLGPGKQPVDVSEP